MKPRPAYIRQAQCVRAMSRGSPAADGWSKKLKCLKGSEAGILGALRDVRFTPKSRHWQTTVGCPLCARSGHRLGLFDHLIGATKQALTFHCALPRILVRRMKIASP
jgi:hypothetical protein